MNDYPVNIKQNTYDKTQELAGRCMLFPKKVIDLIFRVYLEQNGFYYAIHYVVQYSKSRNTKNTSD